ncbi:UNVERIFIED_CONTAM: hypothetical protein Sradi_5090700 [Sesamum radiatum]|uniref:Zinc knuckle CX2CX4HX4C domain-containing protein n=1 Tax=Sesamum radiatum TaxID=300843 RepID=A0AAW2M1D1_SESRA
MHVDLDWCEFFIHVHDFPLSKMNREVASFIGNSLGKFRDMEMDGYGRAWGSSLHIRIINMTQPLIRALRVCTTMGMEMVVSFTYEQLQNFCYLCGWLGHIHSYCELRFEEGFTNPIEAMSYRTWLHAFPINWSSHTIGKSSDPPTDRWRQPNIPRGPEVFGVFGDKGKWVLQGKESSGYRSGDGNSVEEVQSAKLKSHVCPPGFHDRAPSNAPSTSLVSSVLATVLPRNDIVPSVPAIPD